MASVQDCHVAFGKSAILGAVETNLRETSRFVSLMGYSTCTSPMLQKHVLGALDLNRANRTVLTVLILTVEMENAFVLYSE